MRPTNLLQKLAISTISIKDHDLIEYSDQLQDQKVYDIIFLT